MLRPNRKTVIGKVLSANMQKTIIVQTERLVRHAKYKRIIHRYSKFKVHDEEAKAKAGDVVEIMETRPISKDKRWRLIRIINNTKELK